MKRGLCTGACPLHRGGPWATTCRSMTNLMDDFKPTARWMVSPSLDQHTYPPLALRKLPQFTGPLLIRIRCSDTSWKAALSMKVQHEGALTHLCIIRKNGQVTYTARQVACHLENNSRGKRSPILQKRRGLTLLYQHAGTLRSESEMERNTEVPASTRDESLLHSTKCRGVSRGPSKLHSIPDFSEAL